MPIHLHRWGAKTVLMVITHTHHIVVVAVVVMVVVVGVVSMACVVLLPHLSGARRRRVHVRTTPGWG